MSYFQPVRDKVCVTLLPTPERSALLVTASDDTPIRFANITALGPEVKTLTIGQRVLVNILTGQSVGEQEVILPLSGVWAVVT